MRNYFYLLLIVAIPMLGCKNNEQSADAAPQPQKTAAAPEPQKTDAAPQPQKNEAVPQSQKMEKSKMRSIITDAQMASRKFNVDFTITQWAVSGDTLLIGVQYSGGCKTHDWRVYFSGAMMKSMPPQALLHVAHINDDEDPCRSLIRETLRFDLKSMRQGQTGKVVVKWSGDSAQAATYDY